MKDVILFSDDVKIKAETGKLKKVEAELNQLNDFCNKHEIGPLNARLAKQFATNPKETLRGIYRDRIPAVNEHTRLRNDKDLMLETMKLPSAPEQETFGWIRLAQDELYLFDFGKTVQLNAERLKDHLDQYRYIAADQATVDVFNDFQALAKLLQKIQDKLHCFSKTTLDWDADYGVGKIVQLSNEGEFKIHQTGFERATMKL